ncbi:MAG: cation diffusion facilitator family transporter [Bacteroidales bacterium]
MVHHHQHPHNAITDHQDFKGRNLIVSIALNLFITILQVIGGLVSGSLSLLSDALHNFSDVIALVISYIASVLSGKKQTVKRTFGYKRAEMLAAFINASTLIVVAVLLGVEAVKRFREPQVIDSGWVIGLAGLSILVNGFSVLLLRKDSGNNLNIKSAYIHLFSDMLTSVAILIGGVLMYYFQFYWIDGALTLLISFYLVYVSWGLLIESLKVLMLFTPSSIVIEDISNRIICLEEVKNIHHVHVWQLDDQQIHFEAHVDFVNDLPLKRVNVILEEIKQLLNTEFNIEHVTLQPEYNSCNEKDLVAD